MPNGSVGVLSSNSLRKIRMGEEMEIKNLGLSYPVGPGALGQCPRPNCPFMSSIHFAPESELSYS